MKLVIGIPTINRADLLNESLAKYYEDFPNTPIIVCDNGSQDIIARENKMVVYRPHVNLGVAGSWNMIMDYSCRVDATHVLMLNDDVYLGRNESEVKKFIINNNFDFYNSEKNWSSFVLPVSTFLKVGDFDTNFFPAYYEDNDYCRRMVLRGVNRINTPFLNPAIYRNSMTIQKSPNLNFGFENNRQYYIKKWGGEPSKETFDKPFNIQF